ncbi:unnamed protein product [Ilex paraguariensis]|uniref:Uncharacterized protein n=1 Tax=Ilex paraguariensis TaxID=185542 RepID=A0ABC8T9T5_9AQUA
MESRYLSPVSTGHKRWEGFLEERFKILLHQTEIQDSAYNFKRLRCSFGCLLYWFVDSFPEEGCTQCHCPKEK